MASPYDLTTEAGTLAYIKDNHFPQCPQVKTLDGGHGGFVYRVVTNDPSVPTVVIKHAQGYAAKAPEWKLDTNRMDFEAKAMEYLSQPEMQSDPLIRIPKILHHDQENHVLFLEDAGSLPSLKNWMTEDVDIATSTQVGKAVGRFLAHLHDSTAGDQKLLAEFNGNETAKKLSGKLYFGGLPKAAQVFGFRDTFIEEAAKFGEAEVMEKSEVLTMGDFWTGNVLVSSGSGPKDLHLYVLDLELTKPGTAEFDIGQMAAEMWCLAQLRRNAQHQGLALLKAFLSSYKANRSVLVDATKVAIRVGAHLFVIMPFAWKNEAMTEQIEEAAVDGREFVRMGWERDEEALRKSVLAPLL